MLASLMVERFFTYLYKAFYTSVYSFAITTYRFVLFI